MSRGRKKNFSPEVALRQATDQFRRRGYAGTSLTDLLSAMGIARKSFYDTFGSKRRLFMQALERYGRDQLDGLEQTLQAGNSPLENIRQALTDWQKAHGQGDTAGCLVGTNAAHFFDDSPEVQAVLDGHFRQMERLLAAALTRAQLGGELVTDADTDDLACLLVAAMQGVALIHRGRQDSAFAQQALRAALASIDRRAFELS